MLPSCPDLPLNPPPSPALLLLRQSCTMFQQEGRWRPKDVTLSVQVMPPKEEYSERRARKVGEVR
jgi:hypothetical protein